MASIYKIGTTTGNKVTLDTLVTHDPQPAFAHYADYAQLGDGTRRGIGYLMAEWRWAFITRSDAIALRTYCADVSGAVYITTPDTDGVFTGYGATMHWPQIPEPLHGDYFEDFVIEFTEMVEAGGTT
jgi:hypothetical protein